jgi:hypothetical protein
LGLSSFERQILLLRHPRTNISSLVSLPLYPGAIPPSAVFRDNLPFHFILGNTSFLLFCILGNTSPPRYHQRLASLPYFAPSVSKGTFCCIKWRQSLQLYPRTIFRAKISFTLYPREAYLPLYIQGQTFQEQTCLPLHIQEQTFLYHYIQEQTSRLRHFLQQPGASLPIAVSKGKLPFTV